MKKWSLSSSQNIPSKGMEKFQGFKLKDLDEYVAKWGTDDNGDPNPEGLLYLNQNLNHSPKESDSDAEEIESDEQDYTQDNDLSDIASDIEEINDLACSSPFLKTIKEFCILERENKIRKGESWKCKACNFSNYSSRLSCYRCKCWKWEKSSHKSNFPTFIQKDQIIKWIKNKREKDTRSIKFGKLECFQGPRYALVSSLGWNKVLKIERAGELSFNSSRQVTRASQVYIRGGKEQESLPSKLRAKDFKAGPQSINSEPSNYMSASHSELDSIKALIRERWWKSEENWLSNEDWTKLSLFERTMLRFKFSYSHLNVDAFTWSKFSYLEKNEFRRRKKRWINEHMKKASESQMKMLKFWKSRFRWKKMIWSIKDQKWKNYLKNSFSEQ